MKTVLPIKPEPLYVSRYESAVITGVIQANAENAGKDISPWLSGLMANYHHSTGFLWQFDTIKDMNWYSGQKLFKKFSYLFDDRMSGWSRNDIISLIRKSVASGQYVHAKADTFFLSGDLAYRSVHRNVECLIYGFDEADNSVFCARFKPTAPVYLFKAGIDDIGDAIISKEDHRIPLDILEFNSEFQFTLDEKTLHNDLYDFLHSTKRNRPLIQDCKIFYGIEALKRFHEYLSLVGEYYDQIDPKYYTSFLDFQTAAVIRTGYLYKSGYLTDENLLEDAARLESAKGSFLRCCKEYNSSKECRMLTSVINLFDEIVDIDIKLAESTVKAIKKKFSQQQY